MTGYMTKTSAIRMLKVVLLIAVVCFIFSGLKGFSIVYSGLYAYLIVFIVKHLK